MSLVAPLRTVIAVAFATVLAVFAVALGVSAAAPSAASAADREPLPTTRPAATHAAAQRITPDARRFMITVRGRAMAVLVCDVQAGFLCRVAERRRGRRWVAELPSGPVNRPGVLDLRGDAERLLAGSAPRFHVAVMALRGPVHTRRVFRGAYMAR